MTRNGHVGLLDGTQNEVGAELQVPVLSDEAIDAGHREGFPPVAVGELAENFVGQPRPRSRNHSHPLASTIIVERRVHEELVLGVRNLLPEVFAVQLRRQTLCEVQFQPSRLVGRRGRQVFVPHSGQFPGYSGGQWVHDREPVLHRGIVAEVEHGKELFFPPFLLFDVEHLGDQHAGEDGEEDDHQEARFGPSLAVPLEGRHLCRAKDGEGAFLLHRQLLPRLWCRTVSLSESGIIPVRPENPEIKKDEWLKTVQNT